MFPGATPGAAQRQGPKLTVPLAPTIRAAIRRSSWQQCVFLGLAGVLVVLLCLLVIIVALASVKPSQNPHATAQGPLSPTPTPIPMVRVTIKLVDVFCGTKENALFSHDQFYMMTTFASPDKDRKARASTQSQLSQPIDITGGQEARLDLMVFDGLVPQQGSVTGGLTAYNDTQNLEWANIQSWSVDVAQTVAGGLINAGIDSGSLGTVAAGVILDMAVKAWYATANLSSDNAHQLGKMELTVPASGLPSDDEVWHFSHTNSVLDNWDYTVRYQVTRTLVPAGTTPSTSQS